MCIETGEHKHFWFARKVHEVHTDENHNLRSRHMEFSFELNIISCLRDKELVQIQKKDRTTASIKVSIGSCGRTP